MAFNKPGDVLSSKSGQVFATINGNNMLLAQVSEFEAKLEGNVESVNRLGARLTGHKMTSMEGTGSMTMYHMTSTFAETAANWIEQGIYPDISITVTVEDPSSSAGKQVFQLMDVVLKDSMLASLKADDGLLEMDTDFTFDDFRLLQKFN
ncbi:phage tail tube protein [Leuconostocaceae bacterium ESL0958]|nr:phage tail tube protein [Leuconostocaceae bacterium ESL0958]